MRHMVQERNLRAIKIAWGAIASMEAQLEKSITSLIIYGEHAKSDYEFIRNHLAIIMMNEAYQDKRREPKYISIYHLF